MAVLAMALIFNVLLFKGALQVNAMGLTEGNLLTLIENYGEENVIVENGLSMSVAQEKSLINEEIGQASSLISTDNNIVKVIGNNSIKAIAPGTAFVVGEVSGKQHILEVYVENGSKLSRKLNTASKSTNNVKSVGYYKVFIDAGHGGKDPGAMANGVREADINLSVALKVEQKLKARNISVMMSRTTNVFVELKERARLANEYGAHVFVSIHQNAASSSSARGIETYYHEAKPQHKLFASKIQTELINKTGANNRGVLSQDFLVNRETIMPSALVESGYITNYSEAMALSTDSYQEKVANAIVDGVVNYLRENIEFYTWVNENDHWYYINGITGIKQVGWVLDDGHWYYLNSEGIMQTGWLINNNTKYYLGSDGKMQVGLVKINDKYYYFDPVYGGIKTGWVWHNNLWYYFDINGEMKTGWVTDNNTKYCLGPNGEMQVGLVNDNGKYYYFDVIYGGMKTGWVWHNNHWYYFDKTGEMKTGWITDNSIKYYLGPNGEMQVGWILDNDKWYYFDLVYGGMKTGWITDRNIKYYLGSNGEMQVGWVLDNDKWYYFDLVYGGMKTGWIKVGDITYYLNDNGAMKTGWLLQNDKWYYFDIYGAMRTGWYKVDGDDFYFYSNGIMAANTAIDGRKIDIYGRAK